MSDLLQLPASIELPSTRPDEEWFQPDPAVRLEAAQVARELDCHEVMASRLVMLGYDAQAVCDYLHPAPQHIRHPEDTVPGMTAAARELSEAVAAGAHVAIYADYDVDGQTSLAILSETLEHYGATVHTGSANAVTGFGLSRDFVESAAAAGASWLVTVDCGSTQTEPVKLAQSLGMKVVVIDHHDVDIDNPCEHHLNPRLRAAVALHAVCEAVRESDCRQKLQFKGPFDEQLAKLTDRSRGILASWFGDEEFARLCADIEAGAHPTNTGSMLTWKFAAALHLARHPRVPASHWGKPLYLGGLGAIADLAPSDDIEVRAFVRVSTNDALQHDHFNNMKTVPLGLRLLSEELGEDTSRPDQLIRTRALVNLPKRTAEISPDDIQTLLRSDSLAELGPLIPRLVSDYERLSAIRREEMDPAALEQVAEAAARGELTYFAYAVLDGFEAYAGYTRMVANTLNRELSKPAIAFACKGVDEFGQKLYKFSGANDVVPEAQLGELIFDEALREACTVRMRDWLGQECDIVNLGGHTAVVSGVVCEENIEAAKAAFEAWAAAKDEKKKWRPVDKKRPRVAKRRVGPKLLRRLEREAELLYPIAFPEAPALQITVCATVSGLSIDEVTGGWKGMLVLEDGTERPVKLSDELAATVRAFPAQRLECVIALGRSGGYYVSKAAVA